MDNGGPMLFALDASQSFGRLVVEALGTALSAHEERTFADGEHKSRPLVSVRGRDVYVIHSLYAEPGQSANDKLVRLLLFLGALKDAAAGRVTAVVPYLADARKDRKTKSRDPVTTATLRRCSRRWAPIASSPSTCTISRRIKTRSAAAASTWKQARFSYATSSRCSAMDR